MEEIQEKERKRMEDLAKFAKWEREEGDLAAYWRATNLLPGAMQEAGVWKSVRRSEMEKVKRGFMGREEEETESYSTRLAMALERSGVPPVYSLPIAKVVANKWLGKHRSGKEAATLMKFIARKKIRTETPRIYDDVAKDMHRLIRRILANPALGRSGMARREYKEIQKKLMEATKRDVLGYRGVLTMDILQNPGRISRALQRAEDPDKYVRERQREVFKEYKNKVLKLAALMNQLESTLFYLQHKLLQIPRGTAKIESYAMLRKGAERKNFEMAKNISKIGYEEFKRAVIETMREQNLTPRDMQFTSIDEALERLEKMREELEDLFPHIRKKLKEKETR